MAEVWTFLILTGIGWTSSSAYYSREACEAAREFYAEHLGSLGIEKVSSSCHIEEKVEHSQ